MGEQLDLSSQRYAFRDSLTPDGKKLWQGVALYPFIERINRAGVPIYMTTGWYDIFVGDLFFWWDNLTAPKRLTIRPLDHTGMDKSDVDLDYAAEARRWFDRWLKGADNGISEEPPIHYYEMGAPRESAWQSSHSWPPPGQISTSYYFAPGRSGTASSVNDGSLITVAPREPIGFDPYTRRLHHNQRQTLSLDRREFSPRLSGSTQRGRKGVDLYRPAAWPKHETSPDIRSRIFGSRPRPRILTCSFTWRK